VQKGNISFVMSVCLSVHPHGTSRLPLDGFSWNFIFEDFFLEKSVGKLHVWLKSDKKNGHEDLRTFIISVWTLLRFRNVSDVVCRENQNTPFMLNIFSTENCTVYVEKIPLVGNVLRRKPRCHILCECEALASLRHTYPGSFFLNPEDIRKLSIGVIWNFAKGTGLL
jgi:hypothetical protein